MLISEPGQPFQSQFVLYRTDIGLIKQTINMTSRCNKVDAVRLYASYRLNLLLLKGQRCVRRGIFIWCTVQFFEKKFSEICSPKFWHLKSPVEKSPWNKKSIEIKSYHFETIFSRTFFLAPVWFLYKKVPGKKSHFTVKNAWKQRMFTTMEKNDFILKTPVSIFIMQMHRRKVLFIKNDLDLTS